MTESSSKRVTRYLSVAGRWFLILGTVFAVTFYSGLYVMNNLMTKVYRAKAEIQVRAAGPETAVPFQAEFDAIQSPDVLLSVIKDLGLDKTWAKQDYAANSDDVPDVDALTHLSRMLRVDRKSDTNVIDITVSGGDPQECAAVANAVADHYKVMRDSSRGQSTPLLDAPPGSVVRIISRAVPPTEPSRPNRSFDTIALTVVAVLASLLVASFVEIIFLFVRASERSDS